MKMLQFLKRKKDVKSVENKYDLTVGGYNKLVKDDNKLFELSRTYVLDYAQKWDKEDKKFEVIRSLYQYVGVDLNGDRKNILLKRKFKKDLMSLNNSDIKLFIVAVANLILNYKK